MATLRMAPRTRGGLRNGVHLLLAATCLAAAPGQSQPASAPSAAASDALLQQFRDPPDEARPRVWWHWMNGNISKDGIAKDLAWMKRVGIAGVQNFDVNQRTPQVVENRLIYMTPAWKEAFGFAASEADRLGLELAIASSPGWSETGGPWVKPEDGLKKLVWSETEVIGGRAFAGKLAAPPAVTGAFQDLLKPGGGQAKPAPAHYADVAVLAFPRAPRTFVAPTARDSAGRPLEAAALWDDDLASEFELGASEDRDAPRAIVLTYAQPQTIRSARVFASKAKVPLMGALFSSRIETSLDGSTWRTVAEAPLEDIPATVSFAPVTARHFRLLLVPRTEALEPLIQLGPAAMKMLGVGDAGTVFQRPVKIAEFRLSSEARIDRAEAKAAFALEPDYYALGRDVPDVAGIAPDRVIDLTGRLRADGTLDWRPPRGRWTVLRLGHSLTGATNHPAPAEATGLEVDKFDAPAVRRYMEHYLGMYREASGGLLGERGVRAMVTDSTEIGAANWTPRMIEQFRRLRGYDPTPWLPALTGTIVGSRAASDNFLYDFRRTLSDLMATEHYGTVAAVAHEHKLKVYGEALEGGRPVIGDDMAMRRHADVPMGAMWASAGRRAPQASHLADIKGAASVAHVYGQNLVAAESLTAAGPVWGYGPADLKRIVDLEFALGVNLPVIHTSVHAPVDDKLPGLSLGGTGQYFNRHETWAEMAKPWIDYLARHSLMLQQGRHVADVAYFYGEEAPLTGLYGEKPIADAPRNVGYDFVNADALAGALANDGAELVTPGGARYRVLYLGGSSHRMTLPVLRKLAELVEGGATVVGLKPEGSPSLADDMTEWRAVAARLWPGDNVATIGRGRVIATDDVEVGLRAAGVAPDFRSDGGQADSEILFLHRKLADGDSYFLSNRRDRAQTIDARFRVAGMAPELWHAETGTSEPASYRIENGETIVPLALGPDEAVHVVFRKPAAADAKTFRKIVPTELATLSGPWNVTFQAGRGAPPTATFAELRPLNEDEQAGIKYFSGIATYARAFTAPKDWRSGQPLWLDLGEAREIAEVRVNGKLAGTTWHAPHRLEIGNWTKPGANRLEIKVANLWVNRLIGDAQPGATPVTWTGLQAYDAKAPLRRSGLIGPVRLLSGEPATE